MRDLILEKKTGFTTTLPFEIFDSNGVLFYSSDFVDKIKNGERLDFNMPVGDYKYNGSFQKLDNPVPVKQISLPVKERNIPMRRYKIEFGDNPNKCTIFYAKALILFDRSFRKKPMYIKYAIYYHELGHHWYRTESKADLYATKKLLDLGFNPSQIGLASLESLSDRPEAYERKMKTVNALTINQG